MSDDRAQAIIRQYAAAAAEKAGTSTEFFMEEMNYRALVPLLRAMLSDRGRCVSCGRAFFSERDIRVGHIVPPRHAQDWARLHARNVGLFCSSCKSDKPFDEWLDEQEGDRSA